MKGILFFAINSACIYIIMSAVQRCTPMWSDGYILVMIAVIVLSISGYINGKLS
jgi:hypothetical protein